MIDIEKDYELILNNIEGLFVVDIDGNIKYITDKLAKSFGFCDRKHIIGKKIKDVLKPGVNSLFKIIRTGKEQIAEVYFFNNQIIVSNGFPLHRNGKLIGAFEYDVFENTSNLCGFLDKIFEMSEELNFLKKEYNKIKCSKYSIKDIIGESEAIKKLKKKIQNVAQSNSPVLIQGETGCGKELIAHSIHKLSDRSTKNFVKINCTTIPQTLFESELFGYEEGSFSGASKGGKKGKAELANGGTLFLDEINQLPLSEQPKLLRFLQEKEIEKIGGNSEISVDTRIIVASNQNLSELVREGKFRKDLFYRLNVMQINVSPLRERKEDIPIIADYLLTKINDNLERKTHRVEQIEKDAVEMLCKYDWPGNVRQLQNVLERAVNDCYEKMLKIEHFEDFIMKRVIYNTESSLMLPINIEDIKDKAEKEAITRTLRYCKGNKSKAAELLNISRQTLYNKMEKYKIEG